MALSRAVVPVEASALASASTSELRPAYCLLVAPVAVAGAALALLHMKSPQAVDAIRAVLIAAWAAAGTLVGVRRRNDRIGPIALGVASVGAGAMIADAWGNQTVARLLIGLLPAIALHLLISLPDGRLSTQARRVGAVVGYLLGGIVGLLAPHDATGPDLWPFAVLWLAAAAIGLFVANGRYRLAGATDRRRMQWVGWAMAVAAELSLAIVALRLIATWPPHPTVVALAVTALIPASFVAGTHPKMIARVDVLLTHTVVLAGLTALVIIAYVAVVVALGRTLRDGERSLLLLSMGAAFVASLVYLPLRSKLAYTANQLVYGEHVAPDEALRTWGSRLTRAIPLDELLLQLTESLRKSMSLASAEIFTGRDGRYELAAGVPHRETPTLTIGEKERNVVARAGVSGGTWLDVWIPRLAPTNSANTRVAPIAHGGALLGLVVLTRNEHGEQFTEENDRVVTELARQVALALNNVQLDAALQASLDELKQTNVELQESRLRIVTAGDAERRKLERNLHDGAQQHLVAMAVKLRLAEELVQDDPAEATKVIDELRQNLKDAIVELRALAHGIFPPLLSSGGLREALPAAASRAALPTTVDTEGVGRYSAEIESTVYFCCLEAIQNAAKHAGDGAEIQVRVRETDGDVVFDVIDDGVGFDPHVLASTGHGFVNMTDRLGAVGGRLAVSSSPGHGTSIRGEIPLP